jgi:hypothetical protein
MASAHRGAGSWPALLALAAAVLLTFFWQRSRSTFLRIEGEREQARVLAQRHGLSVAEVFALRDLVGVTVDAAAWERAVAAFPALRAELGEGLAAVALAGQGEWARQQRTRGPDATAAWQQARAAKEALPGLRFLALRERFGARSAARE